RVRRGGGRARPAADGDRRDRGRARPLRADRRRVLALGLLREHADRDGARARIDYSLFVVSRYREERVAGREELAAIAVAGATSSRAVLISGSVFVIALTGMLLVPSNVMKSLAVGAISVGIVSVLAALTLLPALLGKLGDHVDSLRVPFIGRNRGSGDEGRFWGGVVRAVMRHPVVYLVTFGALLIALAIPTLGLNLGASGVSTLPNRLESKQGYEAL